MTAALFRLAFRQSIVSACLAVGAILAAGIVADGLPSSRQLTLPIQGLVIAFLVWSGFLAGARLFSREFKERHVLLVQVLPVARPIAWVGLFLGGLAAGLTSLALLLLLRIPPMTALGESISGPDPDSWGLVVIPLLLYLIFYAAGTCYGLLLSGPAVHAVGLLATGAVVGAAFLLDLTLRGNPLSRDSPDPNLTRAPGLGEMAVVSALTFTLYATLSVWFYSRGELALGRRRWWNVAWMLMGHLVFFGALEGLSSLRVREAPLVLDENGGPAAVSPDGLYLWVVERRAEFPKFSRVQVLEIATGRLVASREITNLRSLVWSGNTLVAALAHWSGFSVLRFPRWASDTVLFLSKELRDVRRERLLPGMSIEHLGLRGNDILLSGRLGAGSRLLALRAGGGPPSLLIETEGGSLSFAPLDDGGVAALAFPGAPPRAWLLDPVVREIPVVGSPTLPGTPVVIGPAVYAGPAIVEEMRRRFPWPSATGVSSPPVLRYVFWSFGERRSRVFALVAQPAGPALDVFTLGPREREWRSVVRNRSAYPVDSNTWLKGWQQPPSESAGACLVGLPNLHLCPDGRAAWTEGERRVVVQDLDSGQQRVFDVDPQVGTDLRVVPRGSGTLITFRSRQGASRFFLWRPGATAPIEVPSGPTFADFVAGVGEGLVYYQGNRQAIFLWQPGAGERQLWPRPPTPPSHGWRLSGL